MCQVTHLTSHRSSSLFSAGIIQSGGMWLETLAEAEAKGEALAREVGCNDTAANMTLACMRKIPGEKLLHAQLRLKWKHVNPCADGFEYPVGATQTSAMLSPTRGTKPVMVGTNLNESALFLCGTNETKEVHSEATFREMVATFSQYRWGEIMGKCRQWVERVLFGHACYPSLTYFLMCPITLSRANQPLPQLPIDSPHRLLPTHPLTHPSPTFSLIPQSLTHPKPIPLLPAPSLPLVPRSKYDANSSAMIAIARAYDADEQYDETQTIFVLPSGTFISTHCLLDL